MPLGERRREGEVAGLAGFKGIACQTLILAIRYKKGTAPYYGTAPLIIRVVKHLPITQPQVFC